MPSDMGGTIGSPKGAIGSSDPGSDPSGAMGGITVGPTAPGAPGTPRAPGAPAFGVAAPGAVARSTGGFIRGRFQED